MAGEFGFGVEGVAGAAGPETRVVRGAAGEVGFLDVFVEGARGGEDVPAGCVEV